MIAEDIYNFSNKNIFIMQPIKNTIINEGLFHKLLIFVSRIFLFLRLFDLFKFLPIFCHPDIKIIAFKK